VAAEELNGPVVLEIPSDPNSLSILRAVVANISAKAGFSPDESTKLVLGIDEACTNIIRHAYFGCCTQRIIITFFTSSQYLEINIRDFGPKSDPATFKARSLDEVRPGGLGLHFIRSAVDELEYEKLADGGMLLKLVKFRTKRENSQIEDKCS